MVAHQFLAVFPTGTDVVDPTPIQDIFPTLPIASTHLGEEIFEEIQQILNGVEINEVNELGQALHHRGEEGWRRRPALQDTEIGQHHLE